MYIVMLEPYHEATLKEEEKSCVSCNKLLLKFIIIFFGRDIIRVNQGQRQANHMIEVGL